MTSTSTPDTIPSLHVGAITRKTLALFAGASGDHNPMHIDSDAAKAAGLDDVFAHGMLTMAYMGRAVTDSFPQSQLRELSGRFTAITPVGAEPVVNLEATDRSEVDGETRLHLSITVVLGDGTQTMRGSAVVALP